MRRLVVPIVAAAVLTLSACGGGGGSSAAPVATGVGAARLIAASADKATQEETAHMAGSVSVDVGGKQQTLPIDGALDFTSGAFQFSMDMSDLGLPSGVGGTIEARLVDGVMYMNLGDLGGDDGLSSMLGDKKWLKLDLSTMPGAAAGGLGSLSSSGLRGTVESLRGAGDVQRIGTETLRGAETTHYRAEIDVAKAVAEAPADVRDKVQSALGSTGGTVPVDVWIDGEGRARKISTNVDTDKVKVATTIEYYDFGADVDVSAPPADEVMDFSSLFGGLRQAFSGGGDPTT